ncbi:MAG TPA: dihydrofolate reductase family protein, partial [Candidatus Dormibacteraeota bacterium]|nr:dihydrofolate reductase family protein [Candidatus Dormibacteraeota bacterium]
MPRPYVVLSCAISVDGRIDRPGEQPLQLSNEADLDRVDGERARADAILVGAGTLRRDDSRLLVRSRDRQAERVAQGRPANPRKVTITESGDLDPSLRFFTAGDAERLVYAPAPAGQRLRGAVAAEVVDAGEPLDLGAVLDDLGERGVGRLLVEGGSTIHTAFLARGLADELQLAVAPFLVGHPRAPRFVH